MTKLKQLTEEKHQQNKSYDAVIIGTGLYGSTIAYKMSQQGYHVLMLEKRDHIGGNVYTENRMGIQIHKYGAHIFHTSNNDIWDFINRFDQMIPFINSPIVNYHGELYHLPFNMNTFYELWGVTTPAQAEKKLAEVTEPYQNTTPQNYEEMMLKLVGKDIYEKFIKGYTEKQWGRKATELSTSLAGRLPIRLKFDNNYFNDTFQGIPQHGYTRIIENMIKSPDVEVVTGVDIQSDVDIEQCLSLLKSSGKLIYTGDIDKIGGYEYGPLDYRSLRFEDKVYDEVDHQGNPVINYTDTDHAYTRVIEHKNFPSEITSEEGKSKTVVTYEYPADWELGKNEPYYPVVNKDTLGKYKQYRKLLSEKYPQMILGGRLGLYRYINMDQAIEMALHAYDKIQKEWDQDDSQMNDPEFKYYQ